MVIDCGADHRLTDPDAWQKFYGGDHPGTWPYGLPELPDGRDALRGAADRRARLLPDVGVVGPGAGPGRGIALPDVVVVAASGTSGAGRTGPRPTCSAPR